MADCFTNVKRWAQDDTQKTIILFILKWSFSTWVRGWKRVCQCRLQADECSLLALSPHSCKSGISGHRGRKTSKKQQCGWKEITTRSHEVPLLLLRMALTQNIPLLALNMGSSHKIQCRLFGAAKFLKAGISSSSPQENRRTCRSGWIRSRESRISPCQTRV